MMPRPYRDAADWAAMLALLRAGRRANTSTYYVHPGDVSWWLYYHTPPVDFAADIVLWEGDGQLLGWALFTPDEGYLDLFVQPALLGGPAAAAMHAWAEAELARRVRALGGASLRMMWIAEADTARRGFLEAHGYQRAAEGEHLRRMYVTRQALAAPPPAARLPAGWEIRGCRGEAELEARARAQSGAFQSKWAWDRYLDRFQRFMRSPVYAGERDRVAVAPDGRIAAFAIHWLDPENGVGHFEPVGTHPEFQRRGLGRAVLWESLAQLRRAGMTHASVCCDADDPRAVAFYQTCGFEIVETLWLYEKRM